jgi:hypothetical protein
MILPFIALLVILFFVVRFFVLAAKKKKQGDDLGDSRAGAPDQSHTPST